MRIGLMLITLSLTLLLFTCGKGEAVTPTTPTVVTNQPELTIQNGQVIEKNTTLKFELIASSTPEQGITLNYQLEGITAEPKVDFEDATGTATLEAGKKSTIIEVPILDDELNEVDEKFRITLTAATNATIKVASAIGLIEDNDDPNNFDEAGYTTPTSFYGYELAWEDDFNGESLNLEDYSYDLGDGCPDLCGWGNNELQLYSDQAENIHVKDGKLVMIANQAANNQLYSAKIITKDKRSFQYGRIDIRAKLPEGQGLWPAIWMLGENIDVVGWPACGEIDIMELVGHQPKKVHGTAHWGAQGEGSTFLTSTYSLDEKFSEKFHVFSLIWEEDELKWYVDEEHFHTITPANMQGKEYRFNRPFYLIFNVAVGGNWPGNPDDTTVFPQQMEVDYVRYFK